MSYAFDLAEGHEPGHSLRACWIGMHVAEELGLGPRERQSLYYTLLLKDAGCASNAARVYQRCGHDDRAAKRSFRWLDLGELRRAVRHVFGQGELRAGLAKRVALVWDLVRGGDALLCELTELRCQRGADVALGLGLGADTAAGIFSLEERWDGSGRPAGLEGEAIHAGARIALLAQVADLFHSAGGRGAALAAVRSRRGSWFDPMLVDAFIGASAQPTFWSGLVAAGLEQRVAILEPRPEEHGMTDEQLDAVAYEFADVIDSKSVFTVGHSRRVAQHADGVARELGMLPSHRRWLRRAALLSNIGKLGLSNATLDKPGELDAAERAEVRRYPAYTEEILSRIDRFRAGRGDASDVMDLSRNAIPLERRIITVCDIYTALTSERPHRAAVSPPEALRTLRGASDAEVDPMCVLALVASRPELRDLEDSATAA